MNVLHAGCGGEKLPPLFGPCAETRLDINPAMKPDVVASFTDMGEIGPFDAAFCSHALEHLYPHEVGTALQEFHRVLGDDGYLVVFVPDLEDVRPTEDVVYVSPCGPISGLDMYYGHHRLIAENPYMAHHCGFTAETLESAFRAAGFKTVATTRLPSSNLMGVAKKC